MADLNDIYNTPETYPSNIPNDIKMIIRQFAGCSICRDDRTLSTRDMDEIEKLKKNLINRLNIEIGFSSEYRKLFLLHTNELPFLNNVNYIEYILTYSCSRTNK